MRPRPLPRRRESRNLEASTGVERGTLLIKVEWYALDARRGDGSDFGENIDAASRSQDMSVTNVVLKHWIGP